VIGRQVEFISEKFPNIHELVLSVQTDEESVWITKFGPRTESLRSGTFSTDIAKYCPHLRYLYLFGMNLYDDDAKS